MVVVGEATTGVPNGVFKLAEGLQVYDIALPVALSVVVAPKQIVCEVA